MKSNFLTYFFGRKDVAIEKPILSANPPTFGRFFGDRLIAASTAPSVNEEDALVNAVLEPYKGPSVFNAMLAEESKLTAFSVYGAARLRSDVDYVYVDGVRIDCIKYKKFVETDARKVILLFAWLGDIMLETNAIDFTTGAPSSAMSLADRAISRLRNDHRFQKEYKACSKSKAALMLYNKAEWWDFTSTTVRSNGFIDMLRTQLLLLVKEFNNTLMVNLRSKATELVATSDFGGKRMPPADKCELPMVIGKAASIILKMIGRTDDPGEKSTGVLAASIGGQGVHRLYSCDAVLTLTNTLLYGLGLQNVARGLTFATRGKPSEFRTVHSPPTVLQAVELPVACTAVAAALLEVELRTLSLTMLHFGLKITPAYTHDHLTREDRMIIQEHKHIMVKAAGKDIDGPIPPYLMELSTIIEGLRSKLDQNLCIPLINQILATQSLQGPPPWPRTEAFC